MYSSINSFSSIHTKNLKYTTPTVKSIDVGTILNLSPVCNYDGGAARQNWYISGSMSTDETWVVLFAQASYSVISTDGGSTWQMLIPIYWNININAYVHPGATGAVRNISDNKQVLFFGKYLSSNGGSTWTTLTATLSSTTMSADGTYLYYTATSGTGVNLFQSTNSGASFTQLTGATINLGNGFPANTDRGFRAVAASASGSVVAAHCSLAVASGGGMYVSTNYGATWSFASSAFIAPTTNYWLSVTDTGTFYGFQTGSANLYISTNYGANWTNLGTINSQSPVRPSIDGTTWITGMGTNNRGFSYSNNSGTNRTNFSFFNNQGNILHVPNGNASGTGAYNCIGMCTTLGTYNGSLIWKLSNDRKTLSYLGPSQLNNNGMIYVNYGCNSVSMSSTGQYILAGWNQGGANNILSMSSNYGVSWKALNWNNPTGGWPLSTVSTTFPSTSYTWQTTCMSGNGQIMIACTAASTAYVFLSTNYGNYFTKISGTGNTTGLPTTIVNTWSWCSISNDGTTILLVANGLTAYVSTNSGTTFTTLGTSNGLPTATSTWLFCAMAYNSPNYMLISSSTAGLYLSTNTGTNWTHIDGPGNSIGLPTVNANYTSLSISNNGDRMLVVQSGLYFTTNYGVSWSRLDGPSATNGLPTTATSNFNVTSMSGDGTVIFSGVNGGSLYLSRNTGATFTVISSATSANGFVQAATGGWSQTVVSNDGNTLYVNLGNALCFNYNGLGNWWCTTNWRTDFTLPAQGFGALMFGYASYNVVKFSGDGSIVLAGTGTYTGGGPTLVISYDGGYTFNFIQNRGQFYGTSAASFQINWLAGSISYSGQYMFMCQTNGVYLTTNYGLIWLCIAGSLAPTAAISTGLPTTAQTWSCSAMSSTGTVSILGITAGALYLSTNSFVTYSIISGPTSQFTTNGLPVTVQNWNKLECSYDGSKILASISSGALYLSTNSGASWTVIGGAANTAGLPTAATAWSSLSISGTSGKYMLVSVNSGGLYLSTTTGTSWTQIAGTTNSYGLPTVASAWTCSAISQDGLIMCAAINNGNLYYSTNSGAAWTNYVYPYKCSTQNFPWYSLSMTSDGSKVFATLSGADYFIITFTKKY